MMAGVVAMPSVIEDFDSQPCKKSRKDAGSPVVKTAITNYFPPVPKPVEKPFSPPRSNTIMDYFSKRAPSCKEKSSSPEQAKEDARPHSAEKHTSPEPVKQVSQKRGRKTSKAARKLVGAEFVNSIEEASCVVVEESHESKEPAAGAFRSSGVLGSDTAALLAQLSAEACIPAETSERNATKIVTDEQAEKADHQDDGSKCAELKTALNSIELSPIVPSKDEAKQVKTAARNTRKRQQQEAKQSEPEEKETEMECSISDKSMEVNLDESSQLNNSTVRISFEDFVRSQSQDETEAHREDEEVKENDSKITKEAEEMNSDELDFSKPEENVVSEEPPSQVSPRTVTIQAEVHVSPKQEATKAVRKLASIFNRKKEACRPGEGVSPHTEAGHQLPSLPAKRKSNVVLQEEDLELAVLESEWTPKCSEAERKQFMAAFKQPSADGSKSKPVKSQGKQKQPGEKNVDAADKVVEADTENLPSVGQTSQPSQGNKATKKKPTRKRGVKAKEEKEAVSASPAAAPAEDQTATTTVEVEEKRPDSPIITASSIQTVRRSRREAVVRKALETTPTTPVRKTRKQTESKDADVTALAQPEDSPVKMSTPKTRKSKYGVFQAQMMCPPDEKESPIRMKFTRSCKNVSTSKAEGGSGINASLTTKASNESKKREQAKKLVQKAKVIQQNKKTVEEKSTLRRSARTSIKRSYCEDEDSVICVEDQTASPLKEPEKTTTQKPLRSLNDVLGKAITPGKETKATSGSKVGSQGQEKPARKVSAVISIFEDSSRDGSETSQDDEQFKARREFLKSGLPESFKKQIAKTAATKEAYSASCSSFQPVTHTMQPPNDCPLWSLPWPESSLLCQLKEFWSQTSSSLPSVSGSLCVKTAPACRSFYKRGSGWRPEVSESVRQLLVEEFSTSNPEFPAQMFIARFLKKRADYQKQFTHLEQEAVTRNANIPKPAEPAGGKRKRISEEGANTVKLAKKRRSNHSEENISTTEPEATKRGGRTRRSQRCRRKDEEEEEETEKTKASLQPAPIPREDDSVCIIDDLVSREDTGKKDVVKEDVLWTDKYLPQHSSDIIGNTSSVRRLHSWLKEWKLRADREERKKQKDKKREDGSYDSDWDCGEDDSQDGEDMLCNTMLITGPTGVGKTAAVYACAQELGFKVFEVNASSQRSGRLILSQLKEATQSHQVDSQGVNAHKPTYFNSYGMSNSGGSVRPGSSPRKVNSPRRVISSPRKPQSPRGAKKGGLTPACLAKFFKTGVSTTKEPQNTTKSEQTASSKKGVKANEAASTHKDLPVKPPASATPKEKSSEEQNKKTATSLILFEEVDVIFDDDSGFLAAIKTFMMTTKRPVILTTSDPAFSSMFDGSFEEIYFKAPSVSVVSSYLQLLCLAEDMRTDPADVTSLLKLNACDIRQSLLQLQFWTRSAGGRPMARPLLPRDKNEAELKSEPKEAAGRSVTVSSALPPCDTGCTESKLGLLNNKPERGIWELLKQSQSLVGEPVCWELLMDSKRQGVDLLYSNMETLLPLPLTHLNTSTRNPEQRMTVSQDQPSATTKEQPSSMLQLDVRLSADSDDCSDSGSPIKVSNRMRENKRHHRPDQHGLDSESDSEDRFLSLCKPSSVPRAKEEIQDGLDSKKVKRKLLTPEERIKSLPVSQCLESIADFLDSMSYMDTLLNGADGHRGMPPVSVVIKDGMTDESGVETGRGSSRTGTGLEIQAVVEALSFHKCQVSAAEAWHKAGQLEGELREQAVAELSLPVAAHREAFSFTQDGPCQPQLVERRREVMENLMLKGVFGTVANSPPAALDYLPIMRCICRSEQLKEQGKVKRRFLHYLSAIHLGLEKSTLQLLAEDFP